MADPTTPQLNKQCFKTENGNNIESYHVGNGIAGNPSSNHLRVKFSYSGDI